MTVLSGDPPSSPSALPSPPNECQDLIRQFACIGMSKAFKRHIGTTWRPKGEYAYGVGGKVEKTGGGGRGKKAKSKANKDPVRTGPALTAIILC